MKSLAYIVAGFITTATIAESLSIPAAAIFLIAVATIVFTNESEAE